MFSTMNLKRLHLLRSSILSGLILLLAGVAQASELPDFTEIVRNSAAAVVKISTSSKPVAKVPDMQGNQEIPEMFRRFFDQRPQQAPLGYLAASRTFAAHERPWRIVGPLEQQQLQFDQGQFHP